MQETKRELKKVTTPNGDIAELLTYVTAREGREIIMTGLVEENGKLHMKSSAQGMVERQDKETTTIVVSLNGSSENIMERLLDLKLEDFNAIREAVSEVLGKKKPIPESEISSTT